jgi:hypothetical protein
MNELRMNRQGHHPAPMKKLAIVASNIAAVVVLADLLLPGLMWDGVANRRFRFHLVESGGKRSVKDARIRVVRDSQSGYLSDTNLAVMVPMVSTDAAGLATVSVMCGAGGSKGLFGKTGGFVISHELLIEADGYRPLSAGLANVVGGRSWPLSKRVFRDGKVVLGPSERKVRFLSPPSLNSIPREIESK